MSSLFKKPKVPKLPPPAPPPPPPPTVEDDAPQVTRKRRKSGRAQTVMAGDLIPSDIGKKTLLG